MRAFSVPQPESTADGKPKFRVIPAGKLHPAIRPRPDDELRFDKRESLNRLCDIGDWRAGRVDELMRELGFGPRIFRKAWEEASCLEGFERLGVVKPEATILSVGAGTERSLYWLANRVERVHATDLYESSWGFGESEDLNHLISSAAPFEYRHDHLVAQRMSGTQLEFPDNTFDAAFTLSSIEHFGDHHAARQAVLEMARTLRPNGIACIVTELLLTTNSRPERFTVDELHQHLLQDVGMELIDPHLDLRISESLLAHPVNLNYETDLSISPHIVLIDVDGHMWTSVILFYRKPAAA